MARWDVIVAGGGTAGACAAIAAGRRGARTLVVEQHGFLGGTQSGALVLPMMSFATASEVLIRGLHEEIVGRCEAHGLGQDGVWFDPETLKFVLEEMVLGAGCELMYHTFIAEPIVDGPTIVGLYTWSKSGRRPLFASQVVDCSGDADVAFRAGAPCEAGRPEDGRNQPASLRFILANVDLQTVADFMADKGGAPQTPPKVTFGFSRGLEGESPLEQIVNQAEADGVFSPEEGGYVQAFSIPGRPGEMAFNCPRITHVDGTRVEDLTRCQVLGRQRIPRIIEFCKRYLRGFDDAYLAWTAPMVGIRETRRIVGEYILTADDVLGARKFEDRIAKNAYPIDIHNPVGEGTTLRRLPPGAYHEVPYRCLVPLAVDNLLVAGRCLSATFEAQASIRVQANCRAFGEAAGTAAAMCVERRMSPRDLPGQELVEVLRSNGANV